MRLKTMQAIPVLSALALGFGCGTDIAEPGGEPASPSATEPAGEPVGVTSEALSLGPETFDPPNCHAAVTICPVGNMHCCPFGKAMTGAHYGSNTFRCQTVVGATEVGCFLTNGSNTRTLEGITMKGCPVGSYMKGHHVGNNQLTCCPYPGTNRPNRWTLDGHGEAAAITTDPALTSTGQFTCAAGTMHACPLMFNSSGVMEGVHVGANYFLCGGTLVPDPG